MKQTKQTMNGPARPSFPLARRLRLMEVVLHPGDALFFPAGWLHHTESLAESVSATCRLEAGGVGGDGGDEGGDGEGERSCGEGGAE